MAAALPRRDADQNILECIGSITQKIACALSQGLFRFPWERFCAVWNTLFRCGRKFEDEDEDMEEFRESLREARRRSSVQTSHVRYPEDTTGKDCGKSNVIVKGPTLFSYDQWGQEGNNHLSF
jgi:hypothetical protein